MNYATYNLLLLNLNFDKSRTFLTMLVYKGFTVAIIYFKKKQHLGRGKHGLFFKVLWKYVDDVDKIRTFLRFELIPTM